MSFQKIYFFLFFFLLFLTLQQVQFLSSQIDKKKLSDILQKKITKLSFLLKQKKKRNNGQKGENSLNFCNIQAKVVNLMISFFLGILSGIQIVHFSLNWTPQYRTIYICPVFEWSTKLDHFIHKKVIKMFFYIKRSSLVENLDI